MSLINNIFTPIEPTMNRFLIRVAKKSFLLGMILTINYPLLVLAEGEAQTRALTLSEAVTKTLNHNPELQVFQYQLEAQQGRVVQAELSPKPEVSLLVEDAFGSGDLNGFDNAQTTLSVSWVLEQALKEKRTAVAVHGQGLIESEKTIRQLDSAAKTASNFLQALAHQERALIASRAIHLAETTVKETSRRVKAGNTSLAELYRAEAELAKRKLVLEDLSHELNTSLRQLAAQWGSTAPDFDSVSGSLTRHADIISFTALKSLINNNPALAKYLSIERVKEAELKLAEEERNPKWTFNTGVRRYEGSGDYGVVAGISIPFGGRNRNQGRIAEVRAELSQHQSEADALRLRIETSLFSVYQQLEHNKHVAQALKAEIIPRLEKALAETRRVYNAGKYSYLEWIAVQNELLDAQSALLDASLAAHLNKIEIERLTGAQITTSFKE